MKVIKVLIGLVILMLTGLVILLTIALLYSPGKLKPFTDENGNTLSGSIREKTFVKIGGVRQGMIIEGKNLNNPILLYVHGGPAFPNYFLIERYNPGLEEIFTVCYWEQRGGGLSYSPEVPIESMTFEQLTTDAIEVTNYLRKHFGKEKIYIMAHSGGTPIAIQAVAKEPQLYEAYIGMAQITRQAESERIAYRYMTEQYSILKDKKALSELKKYPLLDSDTCFSAFYKSFIRDKAMHELGIGTMHSMRSVFWGVFMPVWTCKAYTFKEKLTIWKSKFNFVKNAGFVDQLFEMDIPSAIAKLDVPVYFFSGKYDLTVNSDLSKAYLEQLQAPEKAFFLFDNSAHGPLYEEPEKTVQTIQTEVLKRTNTPTNK
jgi:pimeloyl-ACP methyl ester carboxylesterase